MWKYLTLDLMEDDDAENNEQMLNRCGKQRWELVAVTFIPVLARNRACCRYTFKQSVPDAQS